MTMPAIQDRFTPQEYFELERTSLVKHEYDHGEILAMAGGSPKHAIIIGNVFFQLKLRLQGQPCQPYNSDLRISAESKSRFLYPDTSIVCGPLEFEPADQFRETVSNPRAIVEVTSPSTEKYDRTRKFDAYRKNASFREYILISQEIPRVEIFVRKDDGTWSFDAFDGLDATVKLPSLALEIPLRDIYAAVEFDPRDEPQPEVRESSKR